MPGLGLALAMIFNMASRDSGGNIANKSSKARVGSSGVFIFKGLTLGLGVKDQ